MTSLFSDGNEFNDADMLILWWGVILYIYYNYIFNFGMKNLEDGYLKGRYSYVKVLGSGALGVVGLFIDK